MMFNDVEITMQDYVLYIVAGFAILLLVLLIVYTVVGIKVTDYMRSVRIDAQEERQKLIAAELARDNDSYTAYQEAAKRRALANARADELAALKLEFDEKTESARKETEAILADEAKKMAETSEIIVAPPMKEKYAYDPQTTERFLQQGTRGYDDTRNNELFVKSFEYFTKK